MMIEVTKGNGPPPGCLTEIDVDPANAVGVLCEPTRGDSEGFLPTAFGHEGGIEVVKLAKALPQQHWK